MAIFFGEEFFKSTLLFVHGQIKRVRFLGMLLVRLTGWLPMDGKLGMSARSFFKEVSIKEQRLSFIAFLLTFLNQS